MKNKDYNDLEKHLAEFMIEAPDSELRSKILSLSEKNWKNNRNQAEISLSWNRYFIVLKYAASVAVVLLAVNIFINNRVKRDEISSSKSNNCENEMETNSLLVDIGITCRNRFIYKLKVRDGDSDQICKNDSSWILIKQEMIKSWNYDRIK